MIDGAALEHDDTRYFYISMPQENHAALPENLYNPDFFSGLAIEVFLSRPTKRNQILILPVKIHCLE